MQYLLIPSVKEKPVVISDAPEDKAATATAHLVASDLTGAVGSKVTRWANRLSDRYYAALTNGDPALQPTLAADGALKALSFDGTQYMTLGNSLGFPEQYHLFVVARKAKAGEEPGALIGSSSAGTPNFDTWGAIGVGPEGYDPLANTTEVLTEQELITGPDQRFLVDLSYDGARSRLRFNGQTVADVAQAPYTGSAKPLFYIGGWPVAGVDKWRGLVYEVLLFRRTLSTRELSILTTDLKTRYSL
jgi:hypothetical protein